MRKEKRKLQRKRPAQMSIRQGALATGEEAADAREGGAERHVVQHAGTLEGTRLHSCTGGDGQQPRAPPARASTLRDERSFWGMVPKALAVLRGEDKTVWGVWGRRTCTRFA